MIKAALLIACLALCSCTGFRVGHSKAGHMAMSSDLPGKLAPDKCAVFAKALDARFKTAGIRSQIVSFDHTTARQQDFGNAHGITNYVSDSHAIVVFEDAGRHYYISNFMHAPEWIEAKSWDDAMGFARRTVGIETIVHSASAQ